MIFFSFGAFYIAKADTKATFKKLESFSIELFHITDFDDDDDDDDYDDDNDFKPLSVHFST